MIRTKKIHYNLIVSAFVGAMLLLSCKTDIEMVNALADQEKVPSVVASNVETIYTEQGQIKFIIRAPKTQYFQFAKEPYNEFKEGIEVQTFDDSLNLESKITANYAVYYEEAKLWKAMNNVVAMNTKGEVLNTEQLFWNEEKKKIYSDDMVKFTTEDGVIFGEGFESDEDFNNWEIKKTSGIIYVDEDEEL